MQAATPASTIPHLQIKGALQEGALYIERAADAELERALLAGQYCYVLAPRQIGKSSLRLHAARALVHRGVRCVHIDLTLVGGHDDQEPRRGWYFSLVTVIASQLNLGDPLPFWQRRGEALPVFHFGRYLREQALTRIDAPVVIFIDEIDYLKSLPFDSDEFIDAIRAYSNARGDDPVYQRLTFCLLGVASPVELIRSGQITPFNIGQSISVEDFLRKEMEEFVPVFVPLGEEPAAWLDEVCRWTSGHPYMTQVVCDRIRSQRGAEAQGTVPQRVDRAVSALFLRRGRTADANLSYAEKRMDSQSDPLRKAEMLSMYRRLLQEHAVPIKDGDPVQLELQLCGMAAQREDAVGQRRLYPRNRIFTTIFDLAWVREKETLRKLTLGLRRWLETGRRPETLLRGTDLEESQAWAGEHAGEMTQDENEFLRASLDGARREAEQLRLASETRNQRRLVIGLSAAVAMLLALAAGLYGQFLRAEKAGKVAQTARDAAEGLARSESAAKRAAETAAQQALQSAAAERAATEQARQQAERAELAATQERRARKVAQEATGREQQARQEAEAEKDHAEREKTRAEQEKARAEQAAVNAEAAARTEMSLRALMLATQPKSLLQALVAGMRAAQFSRKAGLGPQWEGLLRTAEESTLATVLQGHSFGLTSAVYSPDGRQIVTTSEARGWHGEAKEARVWDAKDGRLMFSLQGPVTGIQMAAFSPDGRRIATISLGEVQIWGAQDGRLMFGFRDAYEEGDGSGSGSVAYSPDGQLIVTSSSSNVRIWNANDGRLRLKIRGRSAGLIQSAVFSPDGRRIATAGYDNPTRIWDAQKGRLRFVLSQNSGSIDSVAFSPDGQRIVTAGYDNPMRLWEAQTGRMLGAPFEHTGPVGPAAFSPDGQRIVTRSESTAQIWSPGGPHLLLTLKGHTASVNAAAFSPDGQYVLTASEDRTARIWDIKEGNILYSIKVDWLSRFNSAIFSPDGRRIITANSHGTTSVWDVRTGRLLNSLLGFLGDVNSGAISSDGQRLFTINSMALWTWDVNERRLQHTLRMGESMHNVSSFAISPDEQRIVTADADKFSARVWDISPRELGVSRVLFNLEGHTSGINSVSFSTDGRYVVTASKDRTARVWDANQGSLLLRTQGHLASVNSAAFSPDGQRIVTASDDRTAQVWDVKRRALLLNIEGHSSSVNSVTFSPDGRRIVTASQDHTARVWDAKEGTLLLSLQGHSDGVISASFSSDGRYIVTTGNDGKALIHTIDTEEIYAFGCKLLRNLRGLPEASVGEIKPILESCPP